MLASIGGVALLMCRIAQGSDVVFCFDFGNGPTTNVSGVYNPLFWTTSASASYTFSFSE